MSKKHRSIGLLALGTAAVAGAAAALAWQKIRENQQEELARMEEAILLDLDGDGEADVIMEDRDGDGIIDTVSTDTTGDGKPDTTMLDLTGEATWTWSSRGTPRYCGPCGTTVLPLRRFRRKNPQRHNFQKTGHPNTEHILPAFGGELFRRHIYGLRYLHHRRRPGGAHCRIVQRPGRAQNGFTGGKNARRADGGDQRH